MSRLWVMPINKTIADAVSMGASFETSAEPIVNYEHARAVFNFSIQGRWSDGSSPIGYLKLQCSIDNSNWIDIPGTEVPVTGNSGDAFWNFSYQSYKFIRLAYVRTSGGATMTAVFNAVAYNV